MIIHLNSLKYITKRGERETTREMIFFAGHYFYKSSGQSATTAGTVNPSWRNNIWMPFEGSISEKGVIKKPESRDNDTFKQKLKEMLKEMHKKRIIDDELLQNMIQDKYQAQINQTQDCIEEVCHEFARFGSFDMFKKSLQLSDLENDSLLEKLRKHLNIENLRLEPTCIKEYVVDKSSTDVTVPFEDLNTDLTNLFLDKLEKEFTDQLKILETKRDEFPIDSTARCEANKLIRNLHAHLNSLKDMKQISEDDVLQFKYACINDVNDSRAVLEKHRGWKQVLGHLALALIGLGIFYAIGVASYKLSGANFTMFKTDSHKKLDNFSSIINDMTFEKAN